MKLTSNTRFQIRFQNAIFIALLLATFGLLAWLSTRYEIKIDWTMNRRHTLSETSQQILTKLTAPLIITAYASQEEEVRRPIKEWIERYQRHKKDLTLRFVDPFANPTEAKELGIQNNGELLLDYQGRIEHISELKEQDLSAALQRLARPESRLVVFLQGHGEPSPTTFSEQNFNNWADQMRKTGLVVNTLNFGNEATLPTQTTVLVIASPQTLLLPAEVTAITDYVKQGGNLLWLLNPPGRMQGLEPLAKHLGLTVQPGMIVDPVSRLLGVNNPTVVSVTTEGYTSHPVTTGLEEYLTLFPQAVGLTVETLEGWENTAILKTHPQAWSETGKIEDAVEYNEGQDINGPLNIAVALEHEKTSEDQDQAKGDTMKPRQRIMVVGDSDFLTNALLSYGGNPELAMKMINWLASDDTFLDIPTKVATDLELHLSSQATIWLGLVFLFVLPLSLFSTGLFVFLRRRKA